MATKSNSMENATDSSNNNTAVIAYLTIIGLIAAFVMNSEKKDHFVQYHIRQMLGLCVASLALYVVGLIPFVGWLVSLVGSLFLLYLWLMGLLNAVNKKEAPVPILGEKFNEWFKAV